MSDTSEDYSEIVATIKSLAVAASFLGVFAAIIIVSTASTPEAIVSLSAIFFLFVTASFCVMLVLSVRKQRDYWLDLSGRNPAECFGKLIAMSFFGSLLGMSLYIASILGIPLLLQSPFPVEATNDLQLVFNLGNMLAMALLCSACSILTFFVLRLNSN
jgi:hypothetical protein